MKKKCSTCNQMKKMEDYQSNQSMPDGRQRSCRSCQNRLARENRARGIKKGRKRTRSFLLDRGV